MKNNTQINTSYNADRSKCTIAEYEAGTHRKIRTIETLKGFAVDLSYKCYAETFWINASWLNTSWINAFEKTKGEKEKTAVFDNYYKRLFQKHESETVTIKILSNTDFLKETYKSEVENLEKFKKYINYFDIIKDKDIFLQYCDNFILWLERKQTKKPIKEKDNTSKTELTIREKVENAFSFMQSNDPRKHDLILNETDFDNLINWVTYYFENSFKPPDIKHPIQKVNTNKGNVIYTFMSFFKQEHPAKTRPESLFMLIKACFSDYRNDKIGNLKKTSKPQFYNDLVSKNK